MRSHCPIVGQQDADLAVDESALLLLVDIEDEDGRNAANNGWRDVDHRALTDELVVEHLHRQAVGLRRSGAGEAEQGRDSDGNGQHSAHGFSSRKTRFVL